MPFAIIEFVEEWNWSSEAVIECVPIAWLNSTNTLCKWPQKEKGGKYTNITNLRKKQINPEEHWPTYPCKQFLPSIIDDFAIANATCRSLAVNLCRDSSTCNEFENSTICRTRLQKSKRKRRNSLKDHELNSSCDYSDSISSLESPTKFVCDEPSVQSSSTPKDSKNEKRTNLVRTSLKQELSRKNESHCSRKLNLVSVDESTANPISHSDIFPVTEKLTTSHEKATSSVVSVLNVEDCSQDQISSASKSFDLNDQNSLNGISSRLSRVERFVEENLKMTVTIKNTVRRMNMKYELASTEAVIEDTIEEMPKIPIDSEEEFVAFEIFLNQKENFNRFVAMLQSYGKVDTRVGILTSSSYIIDVLSRTMTNGSAENFNWFGKPSYLSKSSKKKAFVETTLWKSIKESVCTKKLENLKDGEKSAIKWFRQAAYRKGGSRYQLKLNKE